MTDCALETMNKISDMELQNFKRSRCIAVFWLGMAVVTLNTQAAETFRKYEPGNVPQNVVDLWQDFDARKEPLDVTVVKEWKADGVVTRYVTFKVGSFKGADAGIAADDKPIVLRTCLVDQLDVKKTMQ